MTALLVDLLVPTDVGQTTLEHGASSARGVLFRRVGTRATALWLVVGFWAGGLVATITGFAIISMDPSLAGGSPPDEAFGIAFYGSLIAGLIGAAGGLVSGAVCAAIVALLRSSHDLDASTFGRLASTITGLAAVGVALMFAAPETARDLLLQVAVPVVVSALAAYPIGRAIWRLANEPR